MIYCTIKVLLPDSSLHNALVVTALLVPSSSPLYKFLPHLHLFLVDFRIGTRWVYCVISLNNKIIIGVANYLYSVCFNLFRKESMH